jgi:hypothetical protein
MTEARYLRARAVADRQIRKWGAVAVLRRGSGDRSCWAMEVQLSAHERHALKNPTSRVFLISAVDLDVAPTKADSLVLYVQPDGTVELPPLRQVAPVAPLAPGGIVVYYELTVDL